MKNFTYIGTIACIPLFAACKTVSGLAEGVAADIGSVLPSTGATVETVGEASNVVGGILMDVSNGQLGAAAAGVVGLLALLKRNNTKVNEARDAARVKRGEPTA